MTTNLTTSALRQMTDRLLHLARAEYQSCVGDDELLQWLEVAESIERQSSELICTQASVSDADQFSRALDALRENITKVQRKFSSVH